METGAPKKQKLDASNETTNEAPPEYGSQEYWEQRYQKHRQLEQNVGEVQHESDENPFHDWYFTFSELSPLILPLILGSRAAEDTTNGWSSKDDQDKSLNESLTKDNVENQQQESEQVDSTDEKAKSVVPSAKESTRSDEAADESDHIEEESEDEEMEEREGLAKNGPISIIEIGCGDVPLGQSLSTALAQQEETTGAQADNIVKEIVCCDYSSTVIDLCKENQRRDLESLRHDSQDKGSERPSFVEVDYITADARKLPFTDNSFHLILEKGTLDAMLSDKENGASNCTQIISDCARVLKEGGYILLVSHINAHTKSGIDWLNSIVVAGLRIGGGKSSKWEIEVHGSDSVDAKEYNEVEEEIELESGTQSGAESDGIGASDDEANATSAVDAENPPENDHDGDTEPTSAQASSPGPAVYIIHNLSKSQDANLKDGDDPPTVPLKFFSY